MIVTVVSKTNSLPALTSHNLKNYVGKKLLHAALGCHYLGSTIKILAAPILLPVGGTFSLFFRKATKKYTKIKLDVRKTEKILNQLDPRSISTKKQLKKHIMKAQAKRAFLFAPAFLGYIGECLSPKAYLAIELKNKFAFVVLQLTSSVIENGVSPYEIRKSVTKGLVLGNFLNPFGIELMSDRIQRIEQSLTYIK